MTSPHSNVALAVSITIFAALPILYHYQRSKTKNRKKKYDNGNEALSSIARRGSQLKPPFPQAVRDMLSKCFLAYLSTIDTDIGTSHLSLMRFTYLHDPEDGEVVIMSTNRKTKKFDMLKKQKGIALLVHDFSPEGGGAYTITLNGKCRIITEPSKEEQYRKYHLQHNPEYPQFIVGKDIAILCVHVTSARICNIHDQVIKWDVANNGRELSVSA